MAIPITFPPLHHVAAAVALAALSATGAQAQGVVTDIGLFLEQLVERHGDLVEQDAHVLEGRTRRQAEIFQRQPGEG